MEKEEAKCALGTGGALSNLLLSRLTNTSHAI